MKIHTIGTDLPPRDDRDWITTSELINEIPHLTYRRIDYWIRTGLLTTLDDPTPGTGWTRRLAEDQVTRVRVIAALLEAGVQLPTIRLIVDELVATGRATSGAVTFALDPNGAAVA